MQRKSWRESEGFLSTEFAGLGVGRWFFFGFLGTGGKGTGGNGSSIWRRIDDVAVYDWVIYFLWIIVQSQVLKATFNSFGNINIKVFYFIMIVINHHYEGTIIMYCKSFVRLFLLITILFFFWLIIIVLIWRYNSGDWSPSFFLTITYQFYLLHKKKYKNIIIF